jgi:S1-C subfamily serine protease
LRLVAVVYAPRAIDSRWSVAIIRDDAAKATQPFIVGSSIRDATIHAIEATRVHLRRRDGQCEVLDGKSAGLRLDGIRSDGPMAAIGLRSGDVIRAINGLDLDSPERAIDAYLKLRAASHISIAADRAGRRIQLDYDVR